MFSTTGLTHITSDNIYSAVGNGDVVKMDYVLMIGEFDKDPDTLLAHTESFKDGVSLSSIKWGFTNTSSTGENSLGDIEFTLHDIAGEAFGSFIRIRSGSVYIHFLPPMSNGEIANKGVMAVYFPLIKDCKMEFNATQGFTYTFSGRPIIQQTKTKIISMAEDLPLTGSDEAPTTGFGDFLNKVFRTQWNSRIRNNTAIKDDEKSQLMIKEFVFVDDDKLFYDDGSATVTIKKAGKKTERLETFVVRKGQSISTVINELFHTRFKSETAFKSQPELEVNFASWSGGENNTDVGLTLQIRFLDNKSEVVDANIGICIGDDIHCGDAKYRGQLTNVNFSDLMTTFVSSSAISKLASGDNTQSGTVSVSVDDKSPIHYDPEGAARDDELAIAQTKSIAMDSTAVWGVLATMMADNKIPGFTISVELPYSFGFTPGELGGLLKDSIVGGTGVGIHYTQGCDLKFYWYTDPNCQSLELQKIISREYRITSVSHTIGLNGNTTEVGLSDLFIGN